MKTQPSSLPLSERLRFFSNLSEASKRNSYSFTRSPPYNSIERSSSMGSYHYYMGNTPRSSTSLSSASVTPTPLESAPPMFLESSAILSKEDSPPTTVSPEAKECGTPQDLTDSRFSIKADIVKTSPFLQNMKQNLAIPPVHMADTETTPTSTLTPTMKRIKLRTIGKLMLPTTFLNSERNNSPNLSANESLNGSENGCENTGPPKKIGKIKSPFIENCNQNQQNQKHSNNSKTNRFDYTPKTPTSVTALSSLENSAVDSNALHGNVAVRRCNNNNSLQTNGHHHTHQHQQQNSEDLNTDSGKENVDTSLQEQTTPVVEIRRKFTRKANTSQSFSNSSSGTTISRHLTPRSASLNGPYSSPQVDDKYAKYFGVKAAKATPITKRLPATTLAHAEFVRSAAEYTPPQLQPQQAVNRNVRLLHSTGRGIKRMASVIHELQKFEDIVVTEKELKLASKEFDNLLNNDTILEHSSIELERIFSSIV